MELHAGGFRRRSLRRAWQLHLSVRTAGRIYERKCSGCKRPQRGMKSKTLPKTPRSRERCKSISVGGRQGARISYLATCGFINGASILRASLQPDAEELLVLFLWIQLGHFHKISSLIYEFYLCGRLQTWWIIPPLWQTSGFLYNGFNSSEAEGRKKRGSIETGLWPCVNNDAHWESWGHFSWFKPPETLGV